MAYKMGFRQSLTDIWDQQAGMLTILEPHQGQDQGPVTLSQSRTMKDQGQLAKDNIPMG